MTESQLDESQVNVAVIRGTLSSDPRIRVLPSGSVVVNYELTAVGRPGERASVPVTWIDPSRPPALRAGDEVVAVGFVRRRFFRAGGLTQSRTEVVAELVSRPSSARAAKVVESAIESLRI